jgi:DNA-binding NtrC family response regulator
MPDQSEGAQSARRKEDSAATTAPVSAASVAAGFVSPVQTGPVIIAVDPASQHLLHQANKAAKSRATILIQGESGTGKDLLAQFIHFAGATSTQPFVKIDCAALPPELIESELFGYERGAFTGATERKPGRLELAGGGTLVLDEIAALGLASQAKLLRVLEDRKYQRLGGVQNVEVGARILALTNVDLQTAVAQKSFREDLFFRLNVVPLIVPPLRERPKDILPLAEHLLEKLCQIHHRPGRKLSAAAAKALESYDFPGNVRELRNLLERTVVDGRSTIIDIEELPEHVRQRLTANEKKPSLEQVEREYIAEILNHTRGKKSKAAQILGISRKTLLEKRKRYGLV